jgi:hypothetical protein
MAIGNFIPTVWSETLLKKLDKAYVSVINCNRDYDGDIREVGGTVRICGVDNVTVKDYSKNTNISAPETLSDFGISIKINNAKYFNFQIDDVDRIQASPKLMEAALQNASLALAAEADKVVYDTCMTTANIIASTQEVTAENIIHEILNARTFFCEKNKCIPNDLILEVSPRVAALITEAKILTLSNNADVLENGYLGSIGGCKIFVTSQIVPYLNEFDVWTHDCILRTKRAVAFAEQISEVEAYRPELRFSDAVKGLHLYGCGVIYPDEVICVKLPAGLNDGNQI